MDPELEKLRDAPLANPIAINLPRGRRPAPKDSQPPSAFGDSPQKVKERKQREAEAKMSELYDYYAKVGLPAETVARHMGIYHLVEDGVDEDGKVKYRRELDVDRVRQELARRRVAPPANQR